MPTYQYHCNDCGADFEEWQKMSDPPLEQCPECGGHAKRVISGGAGLLFKGDGFYITDYRSASYKKDANRDKPASSTDSSKPKKSDSGKKSD